MRKLPWGVISVVSAASLLTAVFVGCGSEDNPSIPDGDSGASSSGSTSSGGGASSSGGGASSSGGSSSGDASTDGPQDGDIQDGQSCALAGQNCTQANAALCCSKICGSDGKCAIAVPDGGGGGCFLTGTTCTAGPQCCSGSCIAGQCSATACKQDSPTAEACTANEQCCSGKCGANGTGTCVAIGGGGGCRTEGNACTQNSQCCSGQCGANGKCINVSFCQQTNDICANDYDCCGGNCVKQGNDALGRCAVIGNAPCNPTGTICTGIGCDNKCCSLSCGPYGTTGVNICQPPSGCKPQDELCAKSSDCCGGPGQLPGQKPSGGLNTQEIQCVIPNNETLGRCESAQCLRPGAVCKAASGACGGTSNNCCESILPNGSLTPNGFCNSNPEACCSRDALGIPRCRGVNFVCDGGAVPAGQTCTTSADCCGKPCVSGKCEGTCVAKGGECTVTADCCAPVECVVPTGATKGVCGGTILPDGGVQPPPPDSGTPPPPTDSGTTVDGGTCALYGQQCTSSGQCCNGVPCSGGICRFN